LSANHNSITAGSRETTMAEVGTAQPDAR
jgi:hypothetical protein